MTLRSGRGDASGEFEDPSGDSDDWDSGDDGTWREIRRGGSGDCGVCCSSEGRLGGCGEEKRLAGTLDSGSSETERPNRAAGEDGDRGDGAGDLALLLPSLEPALSDLLSVRLTMRKYTSDET